MRRLAPDSAVSQMDPETHKPVYAPVAKQRRWPRFIEKYDVDKEVRSFGEGTCATDNSARPSGKGRAVEWERTGSFEGEVEREIRQ